MTVDLLMEDSSVELPIAEAEVWLKSGRMEDARRLGPIRRAICAMPSDVAKHGLPATIEFCH